MIYEATADVKVPSLVAYTPDGSAVRYGVLTEVIGEADQRPEHCIITDIFGGARRVLDSENVDQFAYDDYCRLKSGHNSWTDNIVVKTRNGLVGTIDNIRCMSPYPGLRIFLRLLSSGRCVDEPIDELERFVGHTSIALDYEALVR